MASKGTRTTAVVFGWVLTAAVATAVGIAAVTAIGSGLADSTSAPLSQSDVAASLARPQPPGPPSSAAPASSAPSSQPAAAPSKVLATPGGSVVASCTAGKATLTSWSPNQGYQTDDVDRGPDKTAKIKFDSDEQELTVKVDCPGGQPTAHTTAED